MILVTVNWNGEAKLSINIFTTDAYLLLKCHRNMEAVFVLNTFHDVFYTDIYTLMSEGIAPIVGVPS